MYVSKYVRLQLCMYARWCACTYVRMYVGGLVCRYTCMWVRMRGYLGMYVCMWLLRYVCRYVSTYVGAM